MLLTVTFAINLKIVIPVLEDGQSALTGIRTDFKVWITEGEHARALEKRICQTAGTEQMLISIQANRLSLQNLQPSS